MTVWMRRVARDTLHGIIAYYAPCSLLPLSLEIGCLVSTTTAVWTRMDVTAVVWLFTAVRCRYAGLTDDRTWSVWDMPDAVTLFGAGRRWVLLLVRCGGHLCPPFYSLLRMTCTSHSFLPLLAFLLAGGWAFYHLWCPHAVPIGR